MLEFCCEDWASMNRITIVEKQHIDQFFLPLIRSTLLIAKFQDYKGIYSDRSTSVFSTESLCRERSSKRCKKVTTFCWVTNPPNNTKLNFFDDVKCSVVQWMIRTALFMGVIQKAKPLVHVRFKAWIYQ
jgi:hypothetical protein